MKFRWKIFFLCIGIYLFTLTITGVVVTEKTYNDLLTKEINRCLKEQSNVYKNSVLYLMVNQKQLDEKVDLGSYSQRIVNMFEDENSYIEIYKDNGEIIAPKESVFNFDRSEELKSALNGKRNYILRREKDRHYIFTNQSFEADNKKIILSYIKDITEIDKQKIGQYAFFFEVGIIGLMIITAITGTISKMMIKPIENLTDVTYNITKGNYKDRVKVTNRDEIGILAGRFNTMADEIESKITQLEIESQKKQRFIDNLAHELRTPLTSIIGYAELLMKIKYDEQTFHKGLNYIYFEGSRMLKLINTLMKMIIAREDPFCIFEQNAMPILVDIAEIMKIKCSEKNITLELEGEDVRLPLDKDMIKAVFINLIDNSIKASKENSKIILGIGKKHEEIYLYVKDFGKGMAEEEIAKVTEPFYRVDKSRSRKEGGVGLGLALSSEIIRRHNAKLKIESKVNEGTVVKIIF
ncbi:sensor histidine kinase [Haloimpatiens lingqiaonensis]|uniref:sensor histidine kinase n=1 Tax=Haloimpatiens lingqiaonensis TaxID=1380675 RepID=UPI0010FE1096|nr:HAMP domain-containing sensor histidine kinase [Haloimpatiens lingqiaonensis]